jgi:hypothetical protein
MTSAATGDAPLAPSTERLERPALADRPAITTPSHLLPQDVLEARRERLSRQPLLGLAGLLLVVPTALLLAFGAGGAEPSVLVLAPLVTFALPAVVMVAFWWEDWPGTRLPARWSGWFDTLLIAVAAVVLTGLGQIVVGHLDLRGIFDPTPGPGNAPTFPATMPIAGAAFVAMIQLTLVNEGWPFRRFGRLAGAFAALALSWLLALAVYYAVVNFRPPAGLGLVIRDGWLSNGRLGAVIVLIGLWQVWFFVAWRGWPFSTLEQRWQRLLLGNPVILAGGIATYAAGRGLGARPGTLSAVAGSLIAAALVLAMLFEGWLPGRLTSSGERIALSAGIVVLGAALDLPLHAYATHLHWTRAKPSEWVAHATLNAIGVAIILHVAIGRRWPFGGQRSREAA